MNYSILKENQKKRIDIPFFRLVCFAMFAAWQMGFIFFMTPSLVIDGRTPLPISMDNITTIIAAGYIFAILLMLLLPNITVWLERISASAALLTALGLFFPLPAHILTQLIYVHVFFCCFMIGFESFLMVNYFSEKSIITHLTLAYGIAMVIIAFVQNDFAPVSFNLFRSFTVVMLIMMLIFFFSLPTKKEAYPKYANKSYGLVPPKTLFAGIYILVFISCIMMLAGPAAAAEVKHGVFIAYLADALSAVMVFFLYKRFNIHPIKSVSIFMSLSAVGFLLLYASAYFPIFAYPACILIGCGFMPCQLLPLYGFILMKNYPSRTITPCIMSLALITVLIHSALVELFRNTPNMLQLTYALITVILVVAYLQLAPHMLYAFRRNMDKIEQPNETPANVLLSDLTKREREVLDLIGCGYSNTDIAKILYISEHTVNDYTKKIYRKLNIHSRHAAAQIINKNRNS